MNRPSLKNVSNGTSQARQNLKQQANYSEVKSLPGVWAKAAEQFSDTMALKAPHAKPEVKLTYAQLWQQIQQFAIGLQSLGVQTGERVALFAENSPRWFVADQGIMTAGAVDVVRSSQADTDELLYILSNSETTTLVVEECKTLNKLRDYLDDLPIQLVILLSDEKPEADSSLKILNFAQILETGANRSLEPVEQSPETLATLVYTSGTTGKPKGVMLSHSNLLHQVNAIEVIVQPPNGDRILSVLPTWHIYERTVEYFVLSQGCTLIYTNLRHFKQDLKVQQPNYFVSVPRLLESIQDESQKQFYQESANRQRLINFFLSISERYIQARRIINGLSLEQQYPSAFQIFLARCQTLALAPLHTLAERLVYKKIRTSIDKGLQLIICGGGALPLSLDTFYEIIGMEILEGYGLTETSPVLTARRSCHNVRGSAGQPIPETEIRIVDPQTRETLSSGEKGLVLARGPQIMQGYYHNPEATQKAIDIEGWFNTEDLGWLTDREDLVLTGRAKDTIVLSNGENIEPQPIEAACTRSFYIDQIVVVGQDRRSLGALIVPNLDNLQQWAEENQLQLQLPETKTEKTIDLESKPVRDLFKQELNREVKNRPGYSPNDRIDAFKFVLEPFSPENGMLTQTLKIKRHIVTERYKSLIEEMFS